MTEPRDLSDLVPADVRVEVAAVVAALELHGPAVTKALRRLDRATTAAWNAVTPVDLEITRVIEGAGVTHLTFRVVK